MIDKWSKSLESCKNCTTIRFPHKAKGYCTKCYPLISKIEIIRQWNLEKPDTMKLYPRDTMFWRIDTFDKIKKGFLKQYIARLDHLRFNEENLKGEISGHDLEYKIRKVANLAGVDGALHFYGEANFLNSNFSDKERKIVYELFNRITENARWKGIDWGEVFK